MIGTELVVCALNLELISVSRQRDPKSANQLPASCHMVTVRTSSRSSSAWSPEEDIGLLAPTTNRRTIPSSTRWRRILRPAGAIGPSQHESSERGGVSDDVSEIGDREPGSLNRKKKPSDLRVGMICHPRQVRVQSFQNPSPAPATSPSMALISASPNCTQMRSASGIAITSSIARSAV